MNKREQEILQSQLNTEKRTIKHLKQVYAQAIKDCEKKIRELSMRTDLENIQSIVYQKQYQQAIKGQLEGILEQLHSNEYATISEYLTKCYHEGYIGTMYDLDGQGIPIIMPIDQEAVTKAIQIDSKLSKTLYESLGEDVNKLKTAVKAQVSRGIAAGLTWNQVAENLAKRNMQNTPYGTAINNAIRIARTEGHRIQVASAMDAQTVAKSKGADILKQWNAALDGRTRPHHRMLDGQIRETNEDFEVSGMKVKAPGYFGKPSEDCNCRCALSTRARWALDEAELETLKQRAAYYGLDKTEDFEDYRKKYLKASEEERVRLDVQKMNIIAMTEQEYLDLKGVGSPFGEYQDDKIIGHVKVLHSKATKKDYERTSEEYWKKREAARNEYKEKIKNGELRNKTEIEKSLTKAQGHDDLPSVQAARRMLAKRGIDWKTGEPIVNTTTKQAKEVIKKSNFVKAATLEEAQEKAKNYIGDGYSKTFKNIADYKGISLENANEINRTLEELYERYNIPKLNGIKAISPTSAQGKKIFTSADAVAAYNPVEKGIFLNKDILKNADALAKYNKQSKDAWDLVMQNIDNLSGSQKELALIYQKAGRSLVGDGSVHDYIVHELGHHVQWNVLDTKTNNAMGASMKKYAPNISGYANASKGEYIAESFIAYAKGETDILDPDFVAFMKNGIASSSKSVTIKPTLDYGRRGTGVLKTIQLSKQEYAHVISEINTHMSDEQRKQPVVSKAIGDYIYTFENYGFDNYRIIGKVPIDNDYL